MILIHICVLLINYTNISSLNASKKGETHPYTNTNIKPLSNQQGIYCVAVMQAQWVWTLAMCSVQHKRDNLRSWQRSKQTVAAALKSVTLLLLLSQMTQATGERSTVSWSQWTATRRWTRMRDSAQWRDTVDNSRCAPLYGQMNWS